MDVARGSSTATQHLPGSPGSLLDAWKASADQRCMFLERLVSSITVDTYQIYSELSAQRSPVEPQVSPTIQSPPSIVAYQSPPHHSHNHFQISRQCAVVGRPKMGPSHTLRVLQEQGQLYPTHHPKFVQRQVIRFLPLIKIRVLLV